MTRAGSGAQGNIAAPPRACRRRTAPRRPWSRRPGRPQTPPARPRLPAAPPFPPSEGSRSFPTNLETDCVPLLHCLLRNTHGPYQIHGEIKSVQNRQGSEFLAPVPIKINRDNGDFHCPWEVAARLYSSSIRRGTRWVRMPAPGQVFSQARADAWVPWRFTPANPAPTVRCAVASTGLVCAAQQPTATRQSGRGGQGAVGQRWRGAQGRVEAPRCCPAVRKPALVISLALLRVAT